MKFSWKKCDRIIDINKNSSFWEKKKEKEKVFLKLLIVWSLRLWKILKKRFTVFRYMNPALGMVAHIIRLENLNEGKQILKLVAHLLALYF